jgi:hypothetical protein
MLRKSMIRDLAMLHIRNVVSGGCEMEGIFDVCEDGFG